MEGDCIIAIDGNGGGGGGGGADGGDGCDAGADLSTDVCRFCWVAIDGVDVHPDAFSFLFCFRARISANKSFVFVPFEANGAVCLRVLSTANISFAFFPNISPVFAARLCSAISCIHAGWTAGAAV